MSQSLFIEHYSSFVRSFDSLHLPERLRFAVPLRRYTTWRVGGPADMFVEVKHLDSLIRLVSLARDYGIPFFILGGGSNILVGDKGFRGLVIRNCVVEYEIVGDAQGTVAQKQMYDLLWSSWQDHVTGDARHVPVHYSLYSDLDDPNYHADSVFVRLTSGYQMAAFIRTMLLHGITGLEKFSRIPGTFGGWVYNNTHAHTLFIGDFIHYVRSLTEDGIVVTRSWQELDFGYDCSYFQGHAGVILDGVLRLFRGDAQRALRIAFDVIQHKSAHQPYNSGGCVFKNISEEDQRVRQFESNSVGYIIDKKLNLCGNVRFGGAFISPKHGNFIETNEHATARDILAVMEHVRTVCRAQFGIELEDEVFRVGEF